MKIGFVGLGVMGYPMAGHLQRAGYEVSVYNRTAAKAERWQSEFGGVAVASPEAAARGADIVFTCVGNDDDVRSVVLGPRGVLSGLRRGAVLVDHTTTSAELARELESETRNRGQGFLDAPVSGGQAGAENGALTVMIGGEESIYSGAEPVIQNYARCIKRMGPAGCGQLAKMVNQICIAGLLQGLAEAFRFSERAGLDTAAVVEVISQGAAQSWQMDNRYRTMLAGEYDHGFAVDWMRKDLGIVLGQAEDMGLELPVTQLVDQFYRDVQLMGGGRWDTSSLFARMQAQVELSDGD